MNIAFRRLKLTSKKIGGDYMSPYEAIDLILHFADTMFVFLGLLMVFKQKKEVVR